MRKTKRSLAKAKKAELPSPSLISLFRLKQIRLLHSETKLEIKGGKAPTSIGITAKMGFGASKDEKLLKGEMACAVDLSYEDEEEASTFIHCTYQLLYFIDGTKLPTKTAIKADQQNIMSMIAFQSWPYVREFVHSSSMKMGLPPIILPSLMLGHDQDGTMVVQLQTKDGPARTSIEPTSTPSE